MKNRLIQFLIIIVLVAGVGFVVYSNITDSKSRIVVGKAAPSFILPDLKGNQLSLEQLQGQGVVVNFWATYCKPCLEEMPALQRQYDKYKDEGVVVIGVNVGENAATISGYIRQLDIHFPILLDPSKEVVKRYEVGPIPHTVYIYPDGTVKNVIIGQMSEQTIEKNILEILP